jgi:helix-turn-helix protein/uncharacterized protein DUF5937
VVIRIELGRLDLAGVRFAVSPAYETVMAWSALRAPGESAIHVQWTSWARNRLGDIPDVKLLDALTAYRAKPSSLMPPPDARMPDMAGELRRIRAASPRLIRADIDFLTRHDVRPSRVLRDIHADPDAYLPRIVAALSAAYDALIEPHWARMVRVLDADIAHRAGILAADGAAGVFAGLHREVAWQEGELIVQGVRGPASPQTVALTGQGFVLCPSVFGWPRVTVAMRPIAAGTLRYPARGIAALWAPEAVTSDALAALLGRTRAAMLALLAAPATTGDIADRLDVTPGAVSQHLGVLRAAGLVTSRRDGRTLLHLRTERGDALLR